MRCKHSYTHMFMSVQNSCIWDQLKQYILIDIIYMFREFIQNYCTALTEMFLPVTLITLLTLLTVLTTIITVVTLVTVVTLLTVTLVSNISDMCSGHCLQWDSSHIIIYTNFIFTTVFIPADPRKCL